MSQGKIIYIIGASGSGKDSILKATTQKDPTHFLIAKRYITRPLQQGDDAHIALSEDEFLANLDNGQFAMHWYANGYHYGISTDIFAIAQSGVNVLINGSRDYAPMIKLNHPEIMTVLVSVDDTIWQQRLKNRGRETTEQIAARIKRHQHITLKEADIDKTIYNNNNVEAAVSALREIVTKKKDHSMRY